MSLSLTDLGHELDTIRRARRGDDGASMPSEPIGINCPTDEVSTSPASSLSSLPSPVVMMRALPDPPPDTPAPLCLLCFARSPSAVLLPCCHLNLCYVCAPLFMHKGATESRATRRVEEQQSLALATRDDSAAVVTEQGASPPRTLGRIPFNVALTRAVKGYPQARRLSIGGYVPPPEGFRGGEMRGRDVLGGGEGCGLSRVRESNGRVVLSSSEECDGDGGARCLVCRAAVSGWLRVYS